MTDVAIPYERLLFFQKKLNLNGKDVELLEAYRECFINKKEDFGRYFYDFFYGILRTRVILEHEKPPRRLEKTLTYWFESLFKENLNQAFIGYLWRSGFRHVEVKLDQRYVNLGYAITRQFCQEIIKSEVPKDQVEPVSDVVDKMLDFCILVATDSFVSATTQCDRKVINGIAHQVRNPIMVIGGNIARLQRNVDKDSPTYKMYEAIIQENKRLERMVTDVGVYTELFQKESLFVAVSVESLIRKALDKLTETKAIGNVRIEMDIPPQFSFVQGDPKDLEVLFYYVLENSVEAMSADDSGIRISTKESFQPYFIQIEIFNKGAPPKPEEMDSLFAPFHSSKPTGTGFGLPIASLAARKNLGDVLLEPVGEEGTRCVITLPAPDKK